MESYTCAASKSARASWVRDSFLNPKNDGMIAAVHAGVHTYLLCLSGGRLAKDGS